MGSSSCPGIAEKHCIVAVEFSRLTITVEPVDGKGDREGKPDLREFLPKVQKCQTRRGAPGGIRFLETHGGTGAGI